MLKNIYKYNHPLHGNIHIQVIGKEFSFFSLTKNESYGKRFTFKSETDMKEKINNSFHYHPGDFTLAKMCAYIGAESDDERVQTKRMKAEKEEEYGEEKQLSRIEEYSFPFKELSENLSDKDLLSLMRTSRIMYKFLYMTSRDRLYIRYSLFLNTGNMAIQKEDVWNLHIDTNLTNEQIQKLTEFKSLRSVRIEYGTLSSISTTEDNKTNMVFSSLKFNKLVVEFPKTEDIFWLYYIPKRVRKLTILDGRNKSVKGYPSASIRFQGPLLANDIIEFKCYPLISQEFPDFPYLEILEIHATRFDINYLLPETVVEAKFGHLAEGPKTLPSGIKKLTIGNTYSNRITPFPESLEYLDISLSSSNNNVVQSVFGSRNLGLELNKLPNSVKKLIVITDLNIVDEITTLPDELQELWLYTRRNIIDFKRVGFPSSLRIMRITLTSSLGVISNWPSNLEKLTINIKKEAPNLIVNGLPNSLEEIEFPELIVENLTLPPNVKKFIARSENVDIKVLQQSLEHLAVAYIHDKTVMFPRHFYNENVIFPQNLKHLEYHNVPNDKKIHIPKSLKSLALKYTDILPTTTYIPHLPDDLESLLINVPQNNYVLQLSSENNKNIKYLTIIPPTFIIENSGTIVKDKKKQEIAIQQMIKTMVPLGVEFLTIHYSKHYDYCAIDLLTSPYVIKKLEVKHRVAGTTRTIFLFGQLTVPVFFNDQMGKLRDDILSIEFEKGSIYKEFFELPLSLEYIRLPKSYPREHVEKWSGVAEGRVRVEFNDE